MIRQLTNKRFPDQLLFSLASSSFNDKLIRYADLVAACSQVEWSFHIPGGNWVPGFHWNIHTAAPENPLALQTLK